MPASMDMPDEIISEILSPALRVSDAAFSTLSVAGASPFMTFSESSSAYLVVSKSWLRVATPLLYGVVVIRSKAQAQALAATLTANPALGRFIKKLRVEGGYAISMLKILQTACGSITDLFLSLDVASSDNACGLCRGLPLVDPVRVIVDAPSYHRFLTKPAKKLAEALEKCIPTWKQLAQFEVLHHAGESSTISTGLRQAPNIKTLVVWDYTHYCVTRVPAYMRTIAANPALEHIQIKPIVSPQNRSRFARRMELYDSMKEDARLKVLLDLRDEIPMPTDDEVPFSPVEPPSSPFVYPARLAANPAYEDAIWSRVLFFALQSNTFIEEDSDMTWVLSPRRKVPAPLLVCRMFARLCIPQLYLNPELRNIRSAQCFAARLAQKPALGRHVRSLLLNHGGDTSMFKSIIAHTTALVELHGGSYCQPITWKVFSDLGAATGASLRSVRGIRLAKASGAVSPEAFALFPQMREFCWASTTVFKVQSKLIPSGTFGMLVELTISVFDESFLNVLAYMELPALRKTVFSAAAASGGAKFFQTHGAKLRELTLSESQIVHSELAIWRNCPALTVLGVACDEKHPVSSSCFTTSDVHVCLERIVFVTPQYRLKQPQQTQLNQLVAGLRTTAAFPALREIQHPCCKWPTKDPEISSSPWVKMAESMLERDVHLFGPDGLHWRHRLKFVPKTKQ
ncbi:hypothetical protein DFH08DRAFT_907367 [Mycena albidolilacea]|uniref:Uncharacterized protein n=1 Tax=Mycena albidolilacea TaxID=1033008 RepID=A0AAD6YXD2_9AGAR|nr:hypothetical protein DFH08DRAFT_907367 [Mycena albidolilacea]